jgi:hypothetical protein
VDRFLLPETSLSPSVLARSVDGERGRRPKGDVELDAPVTKTKATKNENKLTPGRIDSDEAKGDSLRTTKRKHEPDRRPELRRKSGTPSEQDRDSTDRPSDTDEKASKQPETTRTKRKSTIIDESKTSERDQKKIKLYVAKCGVRKMWWKELAGLNGKVSV